MTKTIKKRRTIVMEYTLAEYLQTLLDAELSRRGLIKSHDFYSNPKTLSELKESQKKEKRRRAKKITMTVGEYEDALENAKD